jgi:hypothetical protein
MTERYRFSFGEDDPASRRGPGVTGQRHDEEPVPPQRADVREIDLTEDDDEDERDRAEAEAAERVERLREEHDGQATALFPPAEDDAEEAGDDADEAADEAPEPYEVGAPAPPASHQAAGDEDDEDLEEEASQAVGAATVDISGPEVDEAADEEPSAGMSVAPATPLPRSDETAAVEVEGGDAEAAADAGTAVVSADATPALRSGALLATDAEAVRRQFLDIQAGFVDEPRQAVEQAGELVEALHQKVLDSLQAERKQLDDALGGGEPSTEDLRVALRAYRAYVDRLLGLHL